MEEKKRNYLDARCFIWPHFKNIIDLLDFELLVEKWCEENLNDDFTIGNEGVYIYEEEDIVAFKIRWDDHFREKK